MEKREQGSLDGSGYFMLPVSCEQIFRSRSVGHTQTSSVAGSPPQTRLLHNSRTWHISRPPVFHSKNQPPFFFLFIGLMTESVTLY